MDRTIIISHIGGTNNIFANCVAKELSVKLASAVVAKDYIIKDDNFTDEADIELVGDSHITEDHIHRSPTHTGKC